MSIDRSSFVESANKLEENICSENKNGNKNTCIRIQDRSDYCTQCKFRHSCDSYRQRDGEFCESYEPSQLIVCKRCMSRNVCYYRRDIIYRKKDETEYFGSNAKCTYYIGEDEYIKSPTYGVKFYILIFEEDYIGNNDVFDDLSKARLKFPAHSKEELVQMWNKLLRWHEGSWYSVFSVEENSSFCGGVFDRCDIDVIAENLGIEM